MNSVKLLVIIAVVGAIAGIGILSNDIILNAQSITVVDSTEFTDFDCECDVGTDCDQLSPAAKALCGISP